MKASELMIGDWIRYGSRFGIVKAIKTDECLILVSCNGNDELIWETLDNIESIPLTPEILEKNGWEYNNYNNETEYEEEYYVDENGFDVHINGKKFEVRCIDAVNIQLKYLHELQHVLKLCGIEKTIEL